MIDRQSVKTRWRKGIRVYQKGHYNYRGHDDSISPRIVGIYGTTPRVCSCLTIGCGNWRKYMKGKGKNIHLTLQERKDAERVKYDLNDFYNT